MPFGLCLSKAASGGIIWHFNIHWPWCHGVLRKWQGFSNRDRSLNGNLAEDSFLYLLVAVSIGALKTTFCNTSLEISNDQVGLARSAILLIPLMSFTDEINDAMTQMYSGSFWGRLS